jgi:hypothetical protein
VTNSSRERRRSDARLFLRRDRAAGCSGQSFSWKVVAMRLVRTLVVASLAVLLLALAAPADAQSTPTLVAVRAGRHAGFDRVVFEFRGGDVPTHRVGYVDRLVQDGSGDTVTVAGAADLQVVFEGANAHDRGSPTVSPRRFSPGLAAAKEVAQVSDFEAVVTYGIGVDRRRAIEVTTLRGPSRLVVDVSTAGPAGPGTGQDADDLPFTGPPSPGLLVTALALLATGATVLALARRTMTP